MRKIKVTLIRKMKMTMMMRMMKILKSQSLKKFLKLRANLMMKRAVKIIILQVIHKVIILQEIQMLRETQTFQEIQIMILQMEKYTKQMELKQQKVMKNRRSKNLKKDLSLSLPKINQILIMLNTQITLLVEVLWIEMEMSDPTGLIYFDL